MVNVYRLQRAEAVKLLKEMGETADASSWTVLEVKARIRELMVAKENAVVKCPVGDRNTKAEIADSCKRLGVKVNESDTKGQMLTALRNKLNADAKSSTSEARKDATSDEAPNDSADASSSSNTQAIVALACAMADMNERMNKLDHRVLNLEGDSESD